MATLLVPERILCSKARPQTRWGAYKKMRPKQWQNDAQLKQMDRTSRDRTTLDREREAHFFCLKQRKATNFNNSGSNWQPSLILANFLTPTAVCIEKQPGKSLTFQSNTYLDWRTCPGTWVSLSFPLQRSSTPIDGCRETAGVFPHWGYRSLGVPYPLLPNPVLI